MPRSRAKNPPRLAVGVETTQVMEDRVDPWEAKIRIWLASRPEDQREGFTCAQVVKGAFNLAGGWGQGALVATGKVMTKLGYRLVDEKVRGRTVRRYWRADSNARFRARAGE